MVQLLSIRDRFSSLAIAILYLLRENVGNFHKTSPHQYVIQQRVERAKSILSKTDLAIAILLNWRNSYIGYWANLIMIGSTELGLLVFFILPSYFPWLPTGFVGPLFWILAVLSWSGNNQYIRFGWFYNLFRFRYSATGKRHGDLFWGD
jgi:hypothetical protein